MAKKAGILGITILLVFSFGVSLSSQFGHSDNQDDDLELVELVLTFWYIKFVDPEAWEIACTCCCKYTSNADNNEVYFRTPYGDFRGFFDYGMGLYVCGSAAHLFGLPYGQLPRLAEVKNEEEISIP